MADQGNYLAGMLQAGQNSGTDVIGNLNRGMQFGQNVQNIPVQNVFRQQKMQEMEKQKQIDAAIKQYGQTGDITGLQSIDPVMAAQAAKANDYIKSQPPEMVKDLGAAIDQIQRIAPAINSQNWPDIRKRMTAAYKNLSPTDLPPENATEEQLYKFKYAVPLLQAQLKQLGQGPKVLRPNDMLTGPGGQLLAQAPPAPQTPLQEAQALKARTGAAKDMSDIQDPSRKWKPEILIPMEGKGPAISWKPGTPVPPGYAPPKVGLAASKSSEETINNLVDGLDQGFVVPSQLSKRAVDYNKVVGETVKRGLSLPKMQLQYEGAKKFAGSMNSQQMVRFKGLAGSVVNTIDEVQALADQLKQSGVKPLNKLGLEAKINLAGNTPEGQLATRYLAATNTLKEEFANLAQGGYAPTEAVWSLANKQINENYGVDQMRASLGEVKRLINFRVQAFDELKPMSTGMGRGKEEGGKQSFASMPAANIYFGKTMRDTETGTRYKSNGTSWIPVTE